MTSEGAGEVEVRWSQRLRIGDLTLLMEILSENLAVGNCLSRGRRISVSVGGRLRGILDNGRGGKIRTGGRTGVRQLQINGLWNRQIA